MMPARGSVRMLQGTLGALVVLVAGLAFAALLLWVRLGRARAESEKK